jgi:CubicO group peptidase (beta-lactamase class C family)
MDFRYSNSGYIILGKIIEQVTGKSYAEVLKEKILDPLKIVNSGYDNTNHQLESLARGGNRTLTELVPAIYQNMSNLFSAAGMYSTVNVFFCWTRRSIQIN